MKKQIISALLVSSLLSGCAFNKELHDVAVNHNNMVAETANELTLLNIVRAKYNQPMHFTRISSISGDVKLAAEGGATFSLPEGADHTATPSYKASISTNPSYQGEVLDGQKFQNGINKPLDDSVFALYLNQGWQDYLLGALLIEKIDIYAQETMPDTARMRLTLDQAYEKYATDNRLDKELSDQQKAEVRDSLSLNAIPLLTKDDLISTIDNDPDPNSAFGGFLCKYRFFDTKKKVDDTELFTLTDTNLKNLRLSDLSAMDGKRFDLTKDSNSGLLKVMKKGASSHTIGMKVADISRCPPVVDTSNPIGSQFKYGERRLLGTYYPSQSKKVKNSDDVFSVEIWNPYAERKFGVSGTAGREAEFVTKKYKVKYDITLRSIQEIMYFLGEYIREESPYKVGHKPYSLLAVRTGNVPDKNLISTRFDGEIYYISKTAKNPNGDEKPGNLSTVTLTLIQQLLNLQKSADELGNGNAIRLIGN